MAHSSSVQLTKSLQRISSVQKDLHEVCIIILCVYTINYVIQVEFQIHRNVLDKESHDLMHLDILGEYTFNSVLTYSALV